MMLGHHLAAGADPRTVLLQEEEMKIQDEAAASVVGVVCHHAGGLRDVVAPDHRRSPEPYKAARRQHPTRWSGDTRNWDHIREVWLNPENDRALTTMADALKKVGGKN